MKRGNDELANVIAAHLREWEPSPPFVELAIYESADAHLIAGILARFCEQNLSLRIVGGGSTNPASIALPALFLTTAARW